MYTRRATEQNLLGSLEPVHGRHDKLESLLRTEHELLPPTGDGLDNLLHTLLVIVLRLDHLISFLNDLHRCLMRFLQTYMKILHVHDISHQKH
jgi:DNA-binding GntR family transcriptional regulator